MLEGLAKTLLGDTPQELVYKWNDVNALIEKGGKDTQGLQQTRKNIEYALEQGGYKTTVSKGGNNCKMELISS